MYQWPGSTYSMIDRGGCINGALCDYVAVSQKTHDLVSKLSSKIGKPTPSQTAYT